MEARDAARHDDDTNSYDNDEAKDYDGGSCVLLVLVVAGALLLHVGIGIGVDGHSAVARGGNGALPV